MPGLRRKILWSLVPLVVIYGGAELGLRAAGWPRPDGAFVHNEPFWVMDPNLDHEPFPHREEGTTFLVSTDARGMRYPLHELDRPAGVVRVMALGCSTTFGWGVDDEQSYPAVLESLLRADGYPVEVINGGQPGYTSFQGVWLYDTVLRRYDPDVVLVGYVVQDARRAAYTDRSQAVLQQDARYLKHHLLYRSRVYLGLRALLGEIQVRAKERDPEGGDGVYRVPPRDYERNLRRLVAMIREGGAVPVLFGYPLEREGYTAEHRAILQAAAEVLGVPHFDPQDRMERASRERRLYFEHDRGHANADGNALIARWVRDFLVENHLLEGR